MKGQKVLVVEDRETTLLATVGILKHEEYEVVNPGTVRSVDEALNIIASYGERVDRILLGMNLEELRLDDSADGVMVVQHVPAEIRPKIICVSDFVEHYAETLRRYGIVHLATWDNYMLCLAEVCRHLPR